ncbi:MAG: AraC family transcriptional regulator [Acutalibacteraceae bacterium]
MTDGNVCKFVPVSNTADSLHALNFVYEKQGTRADGFTMLSAFTAGLVTGGDGILHTMQRDYALAAGDLFFTFPAVPFALENRKELTYMYITFLGLRANRIFERLGVTKASQVFSGYGHLTAFWEDALMLATGNNIDMLAESVLLFTFSNMCRTMEQPIPAPRSAELVAAVKKYVDEQYSDPELSLESVGRLYSYNIKYLSGLFKKVMGTCFMEYLQTIRIQHACELMQQGLTTIKDIARLSGYKDPLYFSKVFKERMGMSPKQHIHEMEAQAGTNESTV